MNDIIIKNHLLFSGLNENDYQRALRFYEAVEKPYKRGDILNRLGDTLPAFGLVLEGSVQVYMYDYDGQPIIMAQVNPGGTFGESLCFLREEALVMIEAVTDLKILWLKTENMKRETHDPLEQDLFRRFSAMLAHRALAQNRRIQVLSKNTLRAKLITFFSQYAQRHGSDFDLPLNRNSLALYLGTDRSALSRELSRMRNEGLLSYKRNHFTLLRIHKDNS